MNELEMKKWKDSTQREDGVIKQMFVEHMFAGNALKHGEMSIEKLQKSLTDL